MELLKEVYLDNSSTTRVHPEVVKAVVEAMEADYGNPSSLHRLGLQAERRVESSREALAAALGVGPEGIIFTSGGTEANNLMILGSALHGGVRRRHLVTSEVEHPSVLCCFRRLESEGFEVTYLRVDGTGRVDPAELRRNLRKETLLVSVMHVNNEVGSVQPLSELGRVIAEHEPRPLFHVDAAQSLGKLPVEPRKWGADAVSISGHKIHAPKGVGALWTGRRERLMPLLLGGGQERGLRSGTENVPGIAGLGAAARLATGWLADHPARLMRLKVRLAERVRGEIPGARLNGNLEGSAPHIASFSFRGTRGEVLVHALEARGIYVSSGAACSSKKGSPSYVLGAMGIPRALAEGSIRVSFSVDTTEGEVDALVDALKEVVPEIRKAYGTS